MKFIRTSLITLSTLAISAQSVFADAVCKLNGKEVPCGDLPGWFVAIPFVMIVLALLFFVFWLWMLIDCVRYQKENVALWVLLIVLVNPIGAIIYYFAAKKKRKVS